MTERLDLETQSRTDGPDVLSVQFLEDRSLSSVI